MSSFTGSHCSFLPSRNDRFAGKQWLHSAVTVFVANGRSAQGRARVWLEWQVAPLGTSFDAVLLHRGLVRDTGAPGAAGSMVALSERTSGLASGTPYHWRARTASSSAVAPHAPWNSPPRNGARETDLRTQAIVASTHTPSPRGFGLQVDGDTGRAVRVRFTLPIAASVSVGVYDVRGTRVARLAAGEFAAGAHALAWNGRRDDGVRAARSLYLVRLESEQRSASVRVLLGR